MTPDQQLANTSTHGAPFIVAQQRSSLPCHRVVNLGQLLAKASDVLQYRRFDLLTAELPDDRAQLEFGMETDAMVDMSVRQGVHLSCHQNRRWDVDYLAIKQALAEGLLGELFYMETFVGGFSHPCGYWHSHDTISGGTSYDWGGHYLDWIVSLIPERAKAVNGTRHKRVWHDITNAD